VTDDVPCNKRRKKLADLLEGYGRRVQLSVFECRLDGRQYGELCERLRGRIRVEEPSVRIYPISAHTLEQVVIWGGVPMVERPGSVIVIDLRDWAEGVNVGWGGSIYAYIY